MWRLNQGAISIIISPLLRASSYVSGDWNKCERIKRNNYDGMGTVPPPMAKKRGMWSTKIQSRQRLNMRMRSSSLILLFYMCAISVVNLIVNQRTVWYILSEICGWNHKYRHLLETEQHKWNVGIINRWFKPYKKCTRQKPLWNVDQQVAQPQISDIITKFTRRVCVETVNTRKRNVQYSTAIYNTK